ncbi:hypothetical protein DFP72DRAFT_1046654 [Ephemerocybe angulata]|uniref:Uncharacterized protein n=1 Tax=Ephemerocybe angulata TaxID=980116 RepID=A0A8H6HWF6_9AGAR|nr:hypothetical protein DFP72DRAFT_1046654 [Tulosesus angulatus]
MANLSFDFTIPHTGLFVYVSPWNNQSWSPFFVELDRATLQFKTSLEECVRKAKHASLLAFGRLRHHVRGIGSMRNIKRVEGEKLPLLISEKVLSRILTNAIFIDRRTNFFISSTGPEEVCDIPRTVAPTLGILFEHAMTTEASLLPVPFPKNSPVTGARTGQQAGTIGMPMPPLPRVWLRRMYDAINGLSQLSNLRLLVLLDSHRKGNATLRVDGVRIRRFATSPSSTILLENVKASTAKECVVVYLNAAGNQNVPQKREKPVFRKEEQACEMCSPSRETGPGMPKPPCSFYGNETVRYWHPPVIQAGQDHGVLAYAPPLTDRQRGRPTDRRMTFFFFSLLGYGE